MGRLATRARRRAPPCQEHGVVPGAGLALAGGEEEGFEEGLEGGDGGGDDADVEF